MIKEKSDIRDAIKEYVSIILFKYELIFFDFGFGSGSVWKISV